MESEIGRIVWISFNFNSKPDEVCGNNSFLKNKLHQKLFFSDKKIKTKRYWCSNGGKRLWQK